jgi:hypothetical protein
MLSTFYIIQELTDMGIDPKYGPYSLEHVVIDKLFRLNLILQQINKVASSALVGVQIEPCGCPKLNGTIAKIARDIAPCKINKSF